MVDWLADHLPTSNDRGYQLCLCIRCDGWHSWNYPPSNPTYYALPIRLIFTYMDDRGGSVGKN